MSSVGCCWRALANWRLTRSLTSVGGDAAALDRGERVAGRAAAPPDQAAEAAEAAGAEAGDDDRDQSDQEEQPTVAQERSDLRKNGEHGGS